MEAGRGDGGESCGGDASGDGSRGLGGGGPAKKTYAREAPVAAIAVVAATMTAARVLAISAPKRRQNPRKTEYRGSVAPTKEQRIKKLVSRVSVKIEKEEAPRYAPHFELQSALHSPPRIQNQTLQKTVNYRAKPSPLQTYTATKVHETLHFNLTHQTNHFSMKQASKNEVLLVHRIVEPPSL